MAVTPAVAQIRLDLLSDLPSLGAGSVLDLDIGITLGETGVEIELVDGAATLDLTVPAGYALRDVVCPAGIGVDVSASRVTLTPSGRAQLSECVLQVVNVAAASAASVPAILQRNEILMSVDLGLGQQLDRFGAGGEPADGFPKPSGLGAAPADGMDTGRMGLMSSGEDRAASLAFSSSLQQSQRDGAVRNFAAPQMLGASVPRAVVSRAFNIWTEGYLAHVETDDRFGSSEGRSGVLFAGADYLVSPNLLLGMLVQYDDQKRSFDGAPLQFKDNGWLAGPYAVVQLADQVFFQGRVGWGQSQNDVRLDGVFDDSFDSDRWLVKGRLVANLRSGAWLLRPSASIAYVEDDLEAYQSSSGVHVDHRTISLGQAKLGPEIAYRFSAANGYTITPSATLEGIWNFKYESSGLGFDDLVDTSAVRGRAELGTTIQDAGGATFGFAATYDGIGTREFTAIGGRARMTVPLN